MKRTTTTGVSTKRRTVWPRFILALLSVSHLNPCRCTLTGQRTSRNLQTIKTSALKTMTIRFSLWFPQYKDVSDFSALNDPQSSVQKGVIASVFTILCNGADVSVVRDNQDLASQNNLCLSDFVSQPRSLLSTDDISFISSQPELLVRRISGDVLSWATWIMRFGVYQIGSSYYEKSVSDNPNKTFSELEDASVEAMEEAFQRMIDSNILSGQFDEILVSEVDEGVQVFSSPIRKEEETFQEIRSGFFQTAPYKAKTFSAMRFSGVILVVLTQASLFVLYTLAKMRRRKLDRDVRIREEIENRLTATESVGSM